MSTVRYITFVSFCILLTSCNRNAAEHADGGGLESPSSIEFPILLDGGTKAVYRFGKMTPRGLKYFYDTVDVKGKSVALPDSINLTFLSPLSLSGDERVNVPCVIAISIPGMWEETIFGTIDNAGQLKINYIDDIQLSPVNEIAFKPGEWSSVFRSDSIEVAISAMLIPTAVGDHLTGKGKFVLTDHGKTIEQHDVFLVYDIHAGKKLQ